MIEKENYWDWVSTQDIQDYSNRDESIQELMLQSIDYIMPYLDDLCWVDANIIYLQAHKIPQHAIAKYLGISQYGVSKRYHRAMDRLKVKLSRPEANYSTAEQELALAFGKSKGSIMCVYLFNNLSMVALLYGVKEKFDSIDRIKAFINAQNDFNQILTAQKLQNLNIAELKRKQEYATIMESKDRILEIVAKYSKYFELVLKESSIGEVVFNKQNRNRNWNEWEVR